MAIVCFRGWDWQARTKAAIISALSRGTPANDSIRTVAIEKGSR